MPTSHIIYKGELRTNATHLKSGQTIITDAPVDNHGKGEAFSPTDLLATALGSCMLTIMGLAAEEHNFSVDGTTIEVTKIMGENPRRVTEVILDFKFQADNYSEKEIKIIEACTKNCPIGKSLHPELKQTINLNL